MLCWLSVTVLFVQSRISKLFALKYYTFVAFRICTFLWHCLVTQYVGISTYDWNDTMSDISVSLLNLKLEFRFKGNIISLTPDGLYRRYIQYLPLLLSNTMTWFFRLVTLFYHFVTRFTMYNCQGRVSTTQPFACNNKALIGNSFVKFREYAVSVHQNLTETKRITILFSSHISSRSQSNLIDSANFYILIHKQN